MEDISIFIDKNITPTDQDVKAGLGATFSLWCDIQDFVMLRYPKGVSDWNFPGKKYGWSFRIKDNKRAIIYFLPREGYFKVAFVFGQKATDTVLESEIDPAIKTELESARKYAEGRGIGIEVKSGEILADIKQLIEIKLAH